MTTTTRLIVLLFICFSLASKGQNPAIITEIPAETEWLMAHLLWEKSSQIVISGNPKIISSPYGKAVSFNGIDDALFLNELPLQNLLEFTVKMIFKPQTNGVFEQRIRHIGESKGDNSINFIP